MEPPPSPLIEHIEPSDAEFEKAIDTDLLQYDLEYDSDPEDDDTTMGLEEQETLPGSSDYLECLKQSSDLHVLHEGNARATFKREQEVGLFHLFLTKSWFAAMTQWCNKNLALKGKKKVSVEKFMAYVGLEIAMSFVQLNAIHDYWSGKMFLQQHDFKKVMSRDDFTTLRGSVMLHDPDLYNHTLASNDPLHHSRALLAHFLQHAAKIAVPVGTSALDENSAHTKARTKAKCFNAEKPDKFAVRFYVVVSSAFTYVHSMMDNRSGNTTRETAPEAYCRLFRDLRTPFNNIIQDSSQNHNIVKYDSPSACWVLQRAH